MIQRYSNAEIDWIWGDASKVALWQGVELAVIKARASLGIIPESVLITISEILEKTPADIPWWKEREKAIRHDLQAWVEERVRHLPVELRPHFHNGMTSFDTEEPAFSLMLNESTSFVLGLIGKFLNILRILTIKYRYTPMMGMTHGQAAEVQTFGKRCLTWWGDIFFDQGTLIQTRQNLGYSKISGAIGNYGGVTPQIEQKALGILGLEPYYGATQIMPREIYAPLGQALCQLVLTIEKISTAIRLGARTPRPIYQEPFGKQQTGSSRMPGKKNTISTEQEEGMGRMALGYLQMIMLNIRTWEERAIEQSCVERVAWPDLFHIVTHSIKTITNVLEGLQVYPDNMMLDIIDTRGTWAAGPAKEFLREELVGYGITTEDAYRMVQLAAFNVFKPLEWQSELRLKPFISFKEAENWLKIFQNLPKPVVVSIQEILVEGRLEPVPDLEISQEQIGKWNAVLQKFFSEFDNVNAWNKVFSLQDRLKDEAHLYQRLLDV